VIALSLVVGLCLKLAGFSAVSMLFWSAVLNGALAPPSILLLLLPTRKENVMREHRNPRLLSALG